MPGRERIRYSLVVLLAFIAALCIAAFAFSDNAAAPSAGTPALSPEKFEFPSRLRIATFNLHNYRDENRFSETGKFLFHHPKPEKSKAAIRRTILEVRPDVLAVQEIGGEPWLDELAEALARDGLAFPYRALLEGYDKYNRLAVLSRVPFSDVIKIAAPKKLTRGLLGVVVPVAGGEPLTIFNVHLKSKVSSDPDDPESVMRRSAEARFLRRIIEYRVEDEKSAERVPASRRFSPPARMKRNPRERFVLVGDFNDVPGSAPLAPLEVAAFARALPAKRADGDTATFVNPQREYFFAFDRIFVSPKLFKHGYVSDSAGIAEFEWSSEASDHRMVYADFDFSEPSETAAAGTE